jgi:hypothetical protein
MIEVGSRFNYSIITAGCTKFFKFLKKKFCTRFLDFKVPFKILEFKYKKVACTTKTEFILQTGTKAYGQTSNNVLHLSFYIIS